jgi:hypothetical protein
MGERWVDGWWLVVGGWWLVVGGFEVGVFLVITQQKLPLRQAIKTQTGSVDPSIEDPSSIPATLHNEREHRNQSLLASKLASTVQDPTKAVRQTPCVRARTSSQRLPQPVLSFYSLVQ